MFAHRLALLPLVLLAGLAAPAAAQDAERVKLNSVSKQVVVQGGINIATGKGARAATSIGSIHNGVRVDGDLDLVVQARDVTTIAGPGETAITSIGSVHEGARISGRKRVIVSTEQVINQGDGDRPGCVIIGSIGAVPTCDQP